MMVMKHVAISAKYISDILSNQALGYGLKHFFLMLLVTGMIDSLS